MAVSCCLGKLGGSSAPFWQEGWAQRNPAEPSGTARPFWILGLLCRGCWSVLVKIQCYSRNTLLLVLVRFYRSSKRIE